MGRKLDTLASPNGLVVTKVLWVHFGFCFAFGYDAHALIFHYTLRIFDIFFLSPGYTATALSRLISYFFIIFAGKTLLLQQCTRSLSLLLFGCRLLFSRARTHQQHHSTTAL
jgi:hypothetical protein